MKNPTAVFAFVIGVAFGLLLWVGLARSMDLLVICPDHGVTSHFTGNKRFAQKKVYCEYSHPISDSPGVHKFWLECE